MDCKYCAANLTAYLDGELRKEDSVQMKFHISNCASCSGELRSLEQASDLVLSNVQSMELGAESWSRLQARISAPSSRTVWGLSFPIRWRIPAAAIAGAAMLVFGFWGYRQIQENSLNEYIAQYLKAREMRQSFHRVVANGPAADDFFLENPFVEARVGVDLNPFRSEDR